MGGGEGVEGWKKYALFGKFLWKKGCFCSLLVFIRKPLTFGGMNFGTDSVEIWTLIWPPSKQQGGLGWVAYLL